MAGIPMNRTENGIVLPTEVSSQIWQDAQSASVVMQHASRLDLPGEGLTVPMITGDATASWVAETDEIGVGKSTFGSRTFKGEKVGLIELFSNEFKRDLPTLYSALAERLPKTIAKAYDARIFHGANTESFNTLSDAQALALDAEGTYLDVVGIDTAIYEADGVPDAYVLAPRARKVLLEATDTDGRPLLLSNMVDGRNVPSLLGVDVSYAKAVYAAADTDSDEVLGFVGEWAGNAFWGNVQDLRVEISTESTINNGTEQVNLFQRDMFALKVTAHLGFAVRDKAKFVKITGAAATGV